jgi:uncharacterized RDD family membrane protein YckC
VGPDRESAPGDPPASLRRRLGALVYELLLLAAVLLVAGFALLPIVTPAAAPAGGALIVPSPTGRMLSFAGILCVLLVYDVWCWSDGRRTLPMKTWRLSLVRADGAPLSLAVALLRFAGCWIGPALALGGYLMLRPHGYGAHAVWLVAFNFLWALIDPERQFLHDRLAGTRVVDRR